jgi:hypothetical protein
VQIQIQHPVLIGTTVHSPGAVIEVADDLAKRHIRAGTAVVAVSMIECAILPPAETRSHPKRKAE